MAEAPVDRTRSYVRRYSVPSVSQVTVRFGQTESTGLLALCSCRTRKIQLGAVQRSCQATSYSRRLRYPWMSLAIVPRGALRMSQAYDVRKGM